MNNYDYMMTQLGVIEELTKRGVMSLTVIRDLDIFTAFKAMEGFSNQGKYAVLAQDFQLSEKRIEQIILGLSK